MRKETLSSINSNFYIDVNMNKIGLLKILTQDKKMKNLILILLILALANIGTDLTITQVPITGDLLAKLAKGASSYK